MPELESTFTSARKLSLRITLPGVGGPLEIIYAPPRDSAKGFLASLVCISATWRCFAHAPMNMHSLRSAISVKV